MGYFIAFIVGLAIGAGALYFGQAKVKDAIDKLKADFTLIHERISKVEVVAQDAAKKATDIANQATADAKAAASDPLPPIK